MYLKIGINLTFIDLFLFYFFKMVSAWYMDDSDEDQRLDHHKNPPQPVDMKDVVNLTGVLHWKVNTKSFTFSCRIASLILNLLI
jgi:hypothetical protein